MEWWNEFVDWVYSDEGWLVLSTTVFPFVAIVVAGVVAALIGRGSSKRIIAMTDRERRIATVTAVISVARRASRWNTLSAPEQQHVEHLAHEADTRLRLLPLPGTALVADWSTHEIAQMKRNAVNFSFQAEQSLIEFRDRLIEWQAKPGRAKKLFKNDLDSWAYDSSVADQELVHQQQEWAKQQVPDDSVSDSPAEAPATTGSHPTEEYEQLPTTGSIGATTGSTATAEPVQDWPAVEPETGPGTVPASSVRKRTSPDDDLN